MRRLTLIILLVPFLGPRLSRPTEVVPLAPPPGFDVPIESRPNDRAIGVFLVPLDAGEQLDLTRFDAGVRFDLDGDGIVEQVSWPAPGAKVAFLAIDRNGDGRITSGRELVGNAMQPDAPNAAAALLTTFSESQPVPSGSVHEGHALYDRLLLWTDRNADGRGEPDELIKVRDRFTAVGLGFSPVHWLDRNGNDIRFQGWLHTRTDGPGQGEPTSAREELARRWHMFEVVLRTARR